MDKVSTLMLFVGNLVAGVDITRQAYMVSHAWAIFINSRTYSVSECTSGMLNSGL
jgi:hypothetical protein